MYNLIVIQQELDNTNWISDNDLNEDELVVELTLSDLTISEDEFTIDASEDNKLYESWFDQVDNEETKTHL